MSTDQLTEARNAYRETVAQAKKAYEEAYVTGRWP